MRGGFRNHTAHQAWPWKGTEDIGYGNGMASSAVGCTHTARASPQSLVQDGWLGGGWVGWWLGLGWWLGWVVVGLGWVGLLLRLGGCWGWVVAEVGWLLGFIACPQCGQL